MIELSIVIPTYNRVKHLQACLDALNYQTHDAAEFEVVVVIDGSTDNTLEILKHLETPYSLRTIWQTNSGQAAALNRGIIESSGRYIILLDDDIVADPRLVAEHLQVHRRLPNAIVIGQITMSLPPDAGWYASTFAQGWREHYDRLNRGIKKITWEDCYSGNMSAPREAFLTYGGFDVNLIRGFDVELADRLEKQGYKLTYTPTALGCQKEDKNFNQLSRDAENAGKSDVLLYRQDPPRLTEALAAFAQGSWRKLLLRRLLLMFHIPPKFLELLGRLVKTPARRYSIYSLIQTLCYWRGVRRSVEIGFWRQLTYGTPILMYHAIGLPHEPADVYVIPAHRFASQMKWLRRMGYRPITLGQFLACKCDQRLVPTGSVVVTFDDGYEDNYTHAYPILKEQGLTATIFLVSSYIGQANRWDQNKPLSGRPLMSLSQVRELLEHGVHFGAHTCTHPRLTTIPLDQVEEEINLSRQRLETALGVPVDLFAYPFGEYDSSVQDMVQEAGFAAGCTVEAGLNSMNTPAYSLRRTEIWGTDSLTRFLLSLWMGDAEALGWRRNRKQ